MHQKHIVEIKQNTGMQKGSSKMPGHWTFLLLALCGVLLYAVVMPSMMVSQIEVTNSQHKVIVTLTSGHGRLTGSKTQLPGSSRSHSRREVMLLDAQQQAASAMSNKQTEQGLTWQKFWGSELEHGEYNSAVASVQAMARGLPAAVTSLCCGCVLSNVACGSSCKMLSCRIPASN
jgi:hypothetical protein